MTSATFKNIYYLGPDGSNSHKAMFEFLNVSNIKVENKVPQKTIKTTIESLVNDEDSIAVLPIENSIEGIVRETIDNILRIKNQDIRIQGEISISINHLLLSKANDVNQIKKIYSHHQAIAQCSGYLFDNFKTAEIKEVSSTSYAAEKVSLSDDNTLAAIANETSAKIFGLNILSDDLNDEIGNTTRFYVLSRKSLEKTKKGKTSLILSTKNKSGALCEVLKIFHKNNINLTYIDSRPSRKKLGEYLFFIEFDGYEIDDKSICAIEELKDHTDFIRVLGSYQIY